MNTLDTQTLTIIGVVLLALLVAVGAWIYSRKKQSDRLIQRFGPEYGRAVDEMGSRTKAESELREREKRVEKLNIPWNRPKPPGSARTGKPCRDALSTTHREC